MIILVNLCGGVLYEGLFPVRAPAQGSLCVSGPRGLTRECVAGAPANFFTAENKPFCKKGGMSVVTRRIHFYIKIRRFFEICLKMDIEIYRKN